MKQILVNILETADDIKRFAESGIGYAEIAKTQMGVSKDKAFDARIVGAPYMCLPQPVEQTMLAIGKRIWVVGDDGVYPEEIAFLGEHSLLIKGDLCEYEYDDYRHKWFAHISEALDRLASRLGCDADDIKEDADGIWWAPAPKKEQVTEGERSPFAIKANSID